MGDLSITGSGQMQPSGDDAKRLHKAAQQMEGFFLNLLFKQLEDSHMTDDPLFGDSPASNQFNQLFHNALSENAAGTLGFADMIFKQLAVKAGMHAQGQDLAEKKP